MVNSNMFTKDEDALFKTPSYAEEQLANIKKEIGERADSARQTEWKKQQTRQLSP